MCNKFSFISLGVLTMLVGANARGEIILPSPYVSGKIAVADFVVDTDQYMYHTPDAYKSTVVDGRIDDINAAYRAAIGLRFADMRIEAEYGYGNYVISGDWALNTKNGVPGSYPHNLSYPSTYTLKSRVQTFMVNAYYDLFKFCTRYKNAMYTDMNVVEPCCYNAIYITGGIGTAHINESAGVVIDTVMAWGGEPLYESVDSAVNRFIYNVGVGISFAITPNLGADLSYRYTDLGKYSIATTRRDFSSHEIMMGLRYEF